MPRYFFHLERPNRITDDTGEEFPSVEDAARHAQLVASEVGKNSRKKSSVRGVIVMEDEQGRELLTVPLRTFTPPMD
jgi:hypothetical protein